MGQRSIVRAFIAVALLTAGFALAPVGGLAQDATPAMEGDEGPHPAHIHAGSCPDVGDVVFPLTDITHLDMMGSPAAGMEEATPAAGAGMDSTPMAGMGGEMGEVVAMSTSDVDGSLEDILAAEHAINVHLSPEQIDVYIACGDITGEATEGQLEIMLEEQNESGFAGWATLMDNGDGTTTVDVMLTMSDAGAEMGQEAATPTP
jgi:hypothetical protein